MMNKLVECVVQAIQFSAHFLQSHPVFQAKDVVCHGIHSFLKNFSDKIFCPIETLQLTF